MMSAAIDEIVRTIPLNDRVPPHDIEAESAVVSAVLLDPPRLSEVQLILEPEHFYSDANRKIYETIEAIVSKGGTVDILTVRAFLDDRGWLQRVGGPKYLAQILDSVPAVSHLEAYAERVRQKAQARRLIYACQSIASSAYSDTRDVPELLDRAELEVTKITRGLEGRRRFRYLDSIFGPLDPIRWVQRDLFLCPGRPTLWTGFGYSGKTLTLQALAIAVASGERPWGHFKRCVPMRVIHFDYEQGEYATRRRYQRLAFGSGICPEMIEDRLRVACLPDVYLTSPGVEELLVRELDGWDLAIFDSLRAIVPGVDENASDIRKYLDILTRVSTRVGCAIVVIHHHGKGGKDKDKREAPRGNSAIFDAAGTVFALEAKEPGDPIRIRAAKTAAEAAGADVEEMWIAIEDVSNEDASDDKAGLRVRWLDPEEAAESTETDPDHGFEEKVEKVLAVIRRNPGIKGARAVSERASVRYETVRQCLEELLEEDRIQNLGTVARPRYYLAQGEK